MPRPELGNSQLNNNICNVVSKVFVIVVLHDIARNGHSVFPCITDGLVGQVRRTEEQLVTVFGVVATH